MKRFVLGFVVTLLFCASAQAQVVGPKNRQQQVVTSSGSMDLLSGVALNASAASRTIEVLTDGYAAINVCFQATRVAYTDIQLTPTCSIDNGTSYNSIASTSVASGTGTNSAYHDVVTTSSSASMCFMYEINNCTYMKFLFAGTSAGASDLITAQVRLGVSR